MSSHILHDGDDMDVPWIAGDPDPGIDTRLGARSWRVPMECKPGDFSPLPVGATGTGILSGYYLTEETEPASVFSNIIAWDRIYWQIPPARWEVSGIEPHEQTFIAVGKLLPFGSVVKPMLTFTYYSYARATDPRTLVADLAPMKGFFMYGEIPYYYSIGEEAIGDFAKHGDEEITLWKGDIYQRARKYVRKADLFPAATTGEED